MGTIRSIHRDVARTLAAHEQLQPIFEHAREAIADIERHRQLYDYGRQLLDQIEQFRRENAIIADCYRDTVRKYLATRGWYVGPSLTGRNIVNLAKVSSLSGKPQKVAASRTSDGVLVSAKANQVGSFTYVRDLLVQLSGHSPPAAAASLRDA